MRRVGANGIALAVSLALGVLVAEVGARLALNPADYLSVTTIRDDVLGIRVAPGTRGFDDWGFRNPRVPSTAEIVAIGDSHTYGNNAAMPDAWPAVLARATGRTVYNLALGGYGPNQYYHLFEVYALRLKPRWVVCGLYMGDDFENAFLMTYGKDAWSFLRKGDWEGVDADIWGAPEETSWHRQIRAWLARNSVVYQLVVHGPLLAGLRAALQLRQIARGEDPGTTVLTLPDAGIREAFRPVGIRDRLNQSNAAVREGMRITFALLARMDEACREHGCQLVVVVIPTKETVFAEQFSSSAGIHLGPVIADLVGHERQARSRLLEFLDEADIPYVDTVPALRRELDGQLYTRSDRDMHPGKSGYRVIGEAVAEFFRSR